jgi:hypothetical protein
MDFHIVKIYKDKVSTKISKILFLSMYDVKVSDIYFTEFGAALTASRNELLSVILYTIKKPSAVLIYCSLTAEYSS